MEVNKLHSDLKELYKGKDTRRAFNFEFEHKTEKTGLIRLFKKGFWSVMPIAFHSDNILAIKLSPDIKTLQDAPIVSFDEVYNECFTVAPNLKSIIPMANLIFIDETKLIKYFQENIETTVALSKPFFEYIGGGDLDFLEQFLLSDSNQERFENAPAHADQFYKEFWDHYYNTPEQKKAFELSEDLKEDNSYLPVYESADYGIWNNYIRNVLANRAYERIPVEDEDKWEHYWYCAQLPHGFDCDDNSFEEYKIHLGHSGSLVRFFSDSFNSGWKEQYAIFPEEVQKHPIFEATEVIRLSRQYNGEKHFEAAIRLEEEYKDPIASWNALISASYWAGRMGRLDIVEQAWQQAIDLSEKHGWIEIKEVLKDQLAFYNHYKDTI